MKRQNGLTGIIILGFLTYTDQTDKLKLVFFFAKPRTPGHDDTMKDSKLDKNEQQEDFMCINKFIDLDELSKYRDEGHFQQ